MQTINGTVLINLFTGFKTAFRMGQEAAAPQWSKIATRVPSTTKSEIYTWFGQFPIFREWKGDRIKKRLSQYDYTIKNKKYESSIVVPRDDIEDEQTGQYSMLARSQGMAAAMHPDELVFTQLLAGFDTVCYDGQFMYDTDHPVGTEEAGTTSVSNLQAGAQEPWFLVDGSKGLLPIIWQERRPYDIRSIQDLNDSAVYNSDEFEFGIDSRSNTGFGLWQQIFASKDVLDETNFTAARTALELFESDEGRPLNNTATILVCGPGNRSAAENLIKVLNKAGGASNVLHQTVEIVVSAYIK